MTQTLLVIASIASALIFLGIRAFKKFFSKKEACDGCAVSKMQEWK